MTPEQTLARPAAAHTRVAARHSPRLIQLHDSLWRVVRPDGEILGYIETIGTGDDARFQARRYVPRQRRFVVNGEFWRQADAVDALRFG